jgi:E3 ubiquitin-protein ligase HUWE1
MPDDTRDKQPEDLQEAPVEQDEEAARQERLKKHEEEAAVSEADRKRRVMEAVERGRKEAEKAEAERRARVAEAVEKGQKAAEKREEALPGIAERSAQAAKAYEEHVAEVKTHFGREAPAPPPPPTEAGESETTAPPPEPEPAKPPPKPTHFRWGVDPFSGKRLVRTEADWERTERSAQERFAAQAPPQRESQHVPAPTQPEQEDDRWFHSIPGESKESRAKRLAEWEKRQQPRIARERAELGLPPGEPKPAEGQGRPAGGTDQTSQAIQLALSQFAQQLFEKLDEIKKAIHGPFS